jgi:hypothetical protein
LGLLKKYKKPDTNGIVVNVIVTILKSTAGINLSIGSLKTNPGLVSFQHIKDENKATERKPKKIKSQKWWFNIRMIVYITRPYFFKISAKFEQLV